MLGDRRTWGARRFSRGFTLIEMAVVIVITGAVATMLYSGITPALESSRANAAAKKMQRVELALLSYVIQNGCLPCPADGSLPDTNSNAGWSYRDDSTYYGPGNATNNQGCAGTGEKCATVGGSGTGIKNAIGVVPWLSLGLAERDIIDPWGDRISYVATTSLCTTAGSSMVRTPPASYPAGALTVKNNSSIAQTTAAAYVLISYGADRAFAYISGTGNTYSNSFYSGTDPQYLNSPTNTAGGATFQQDTQVNAHGHSHFDDIVRYRTAPDIVRDCGANACGNPAL